MLVKVEMGVKGDAQNFRMGFPGEEATSQQDEWMYVSLSRLRGEKGDR